MKDKEGDSAREPLGHLPSPERRPSAPNSQSLASRMIPSECNLQWEFARWGTLLYRVCLQPSAQFYPGSEHPSFKRTFSDLIPNTVNSSNHRTKLKSPNFPQNSRHQLPAITKKRYCPSAVSVFRKSLVLPPPPDSAPIAPPPFDRARAVSYNCGQPTFLSRPRPSPSSFLR